MKSQQCAASCAMPMAVLLLLLAQGAWSQSVSTPAAAGSQVLQLHGSGDDAISAEIDKMIDLMESRTKPMVHLSYRGAGTAAAQTEFMGPDGAPAVRSWNDFGVGGVPLTTEQYNTLVQAGVQPLQAPFMLSKVAVFTTVPPSALPLNSPGLYLAPCTLAKIYMGQITSWSDPAIIADNPGLNATGAPPLRAVRVAGPSGATRALSIYLNVTCPGVWTVGITPNLDGRVPTSIITMDTHKAILSASTWAQRTAADSSLMGWAIAYGVARSSMRANVYEVQLTNMAGVRMNSSMVNNTRLGESIVSGGYFPVHFDWWPSVGASRAVYSEWPMILLSFMYIRQNATFLGPSGGLLRAWAQLVFSDDAVAAYVDAGLVPIPPAARQDLRSQILSRLQVADNAPTFMWEDNILPVAGQADYVVSSLRTRYETTELWSRQAYMAAELAALQNRMTEVLANLSMAQAVRDQLYAATQTNAQNAATIAKVQEIAIAGVVLAVVLALVALIIGAVYVSRTKAIDAKYSRIITNWIPGRTDSPGSGLAPGSVGGPARGGFVSQGF